MRWRQKKREREREPRGERERELIKEDRCQALVGKTGGRKGRGGGGRDDEREVKRTGCRKGKRREWERVQARGKEEEGTGARNQRRKKGDGGERKELVR